jgi:para-aminobenzoate synthetase component 1
MHAVPLPWLDPRDAALRLAALPGLSWLDSAMVHPELGRWSYVAADPFGHFVARGGEVLWRGLPLPGPPLEALKRLLADLAMPRVPDGPPFQGGAIGAVAYEFGRSLERLPAPAVAEPAIPDIDLAFFDVVLAFDHAGRRAVLLSSGLPERAGSAREARARERAEAVLGLLRREPGDTPRHVPVPPEAFASNFTRERFEDAVRRTVEYILAGDIFQANIAQRFAAALPAGFDPLGFYLTLRRVNAAPFAAYLDRGAYHVASSSPERFLALDGRAVETRPIKGTIRRGRVPEEDFARAQVLTASEKDRAENVMIVDLMRNDLSRVCEPASVEVPRLCARETYASVHHLVSVVTGRLAAGMGATDLVAACFPGGSITGAPKLRAMEIITEIERHARGIYCGSIGWIGLDGAMDLNIAIRTVTFREGSAIFHAGGGITALSEPAAEYEETLAKAERLFAAFRTGP